MAQPTSSDSAIEFSHRQGHQLHSEALASLSRYLDDGNLPICNNWVENQMRPWALGRKNWLFAGSLRSGQRAANIMTLIQSAKLNGWIRMPI